MIKRVAFFVYGLVSYMMFVAVFAYLCGFLGNFIVPKSVDSVATSSVGIAVSVNLLLMTVFGLQHSIMARPGFKRRWTQVVPKPIERSTYVLFTNILLIIFYWLWQPINAVVWDVGNGAGRVVLLGLFGLGWAIAFVSTILLNHFELFGLRQVWLYLRGQPYAHLPFEQPMFYKYVRHPLYVGWFLAFWATPMMTVGHLLFSITMSTYILIAVRIEEKDLVLFHGEAYKEYKRRVPRFVPHLGKEGGHHHDVHSTPA